MSNLEIKAAELIAAHKNSNSKEFLDTFIFEPENIEEQNLGSLYIIGEITETSPNSEYLINLLVATIKKEYYANTSRSPITSLEAALNKTNETLADFAEQGNISWIGNINIIIAALKDGMLYFSQTGRSKAFLIRDKSIINIGQDLVSDLKPHPLKTFSNIANGQIDINDELILATSRFTENMEENEVKKIFSENPNNIIEQFENRLKGSGTALIFIKAEEKSKSSSAINIRKILAKNSHAEKIDGKTGSGNVWKYSQNHPSQKNRLDDIIGELNAAERETEISQKIKFIARAIRFAARIGEKALRFSFNWTKKTSIALYNLLKPKIIAAAREFGRGMNEMSAIAVRKIKMILSKQESPVENSNKQFAGMEAGNIQQAEKPQNKIETALSAIMPDQIKNISAKRKKTIAGVALLALILAITAAGWMNKKKDNEKKIYYANILEMAGKSEIAAESSLIYENKDEAAKLIRETFAGAEQLISAGYFTEQAQELKKKAIGQMDKIDRVTRIESPAKLVDFAANSQSIKTNGIVWSEKNLYAFNSANNALYKYDFTQKTGQIVAVNSENMGHLKIAKPFGAKIIFLTDSPGAAIFDPAKSELKNIPIKLNQNEADIADIDTFGSNLYVLAKNDANIYKHILTAGGYAKGEKWLLSGAEKEIKNPASISIDGDVYLLQNADSGAAALKFAKGIKKELSFPSLLIPLKNAAKIIAANVKNIYILDPENKRVAVVAKNGKTSRQFTSDKFDNLIDFAVNPNEKSLYLLNGTTVYEVAL